jgi:hypothetical protein
MKTKNETTEPPIQVYREWFPASVLLELDGQEVQWHRVRVFATDHGLMIFRARKDVPDFSSPIDMGKTRKPNQATVFNVGVDIHTEDGLVVITPTGGGSCCGSRGTKSLKQWRPSWASQLTSWPT